MTHGVDNKLNGISGYTTWIFPVAIVVITVLSSVMRIYYLPNYPLWEDEARSILTSGNIGKFGFPAFENGEIYTRGILYHYLLYIPLSLFGFASLYALKSIGIIFGALIILLVYKMASELSSQATAVIAAAFVAFSSFENYYVLSIRFYIAFQFFSLLTLYLIYKGWNQQDSKHKKYAVLSFGVTLLLHELGVVFAIIFFVYLLFTRKTDFYKDPYLYGMGVVGAACLYFTLIFNPTVDISGGGQANYDSLPLVMGNNLRYGDQLYFFKFLNKLVAKYGWLVFVGILLPSHKTKKLLYYYYFAVLSIMVIITVISPASEGRYVFNIYPVFIILMCHSIVGLYQLVSDKAIHHFLTQNPGNHGSKEKYIMVGICLLFIFFTAVAAKGNIRNIFNYKSHKQDLEYAHQVVRQSMSTDDLIISTNPDVTWIYIRKPNYFLRQISWSDKGFLTKEFKPFDYDVNEKRDMHMVDTVDELASLLNSDKRVWIITDIKLRMFTSPAMIDFIEKNYQPVHQQHKIAVYSNRI